MQILESSSTILRIVNIPLSQWCYFIETSPRIIGRSVNADIPIPDFYPGVSPQHAETRRDGAMLYMCDLASRRGTWVNGVPIPPHRPVRVVVGDEILLGDVELRVEQTLRAARIDDAHQTFGGDGPTAATAHPLALRGESLKRLSARELDIVMWMRRGFTDDAQLSQVLQRSPHTIRTQVGSILRKLDLHSRAAVIALQVPEPVATP